MVLHLDAILPFKTGARSPGVAIVARDCQTDSILTTPSQFFLNSPLQNLEKLQGDFLWLQVWSKACGTTLGSKDFICMQHFCDRYINGNILK
jgi:hypothetical protein